jgi:hypothetical protein
MVPKAGKIIHIFQNITQHATKAYVGGKQITDIDRASAPMPANPRGHDHY